MVRSVKIMAVGLALACFTMLGQAQAQGQGQVPVKILSDQMDYVQENNTVIFRGNVHVDREDFQIWSDKLTVFMESSGEQGKMSMGPDGSQDIEKLLAEGSVRIERDKQVGTSEKATYWTKRGVVVMEGNPVLKDGESSISGEVITYHLEDNRGVVEGGERQRVQAIFMAPPTP
ncbi:lipopolysaccharide transport periplasmic protein LptA [Desulfonatronum sp. SC1]|uniref:lipopolysaccharide transport periplasmic protein LptA n=1 Tax=Desulfonatronum sp. SC1 TaxID=2109626 RepID=UPI001304968B|nr:lipopolysaccharide transport periplasmic protein LptA [Desulfonatronum sp. SC1]